MNNYLESFLDEDGQGLVEYGLLLTLVVIIVFISLHYFGKRLSNVYNFKIPDTK
jgi:Flp pilus assembly pilin Flp